jgi:hypothetical protein
MFIDGSPGRYFSKNRLVQIIDVPARALKRVIRSNK